MARTHVLRYGVAFLAIGTALVISIRTPLPGGACFVLLLAAVMISTWYGGLGPWLVATLVAVVAGAYFIIPPSDSFQILDFDDYLQLFAFVAAASIVGALTVERANAKKAAERQAQRQGALSAFGQASLAAKDPSSLFDRATALVAEATGAEHTQLLELQPGGDLFLLKAGRGWKEGLVGTATVPTGTRSQAGHALMSKGSVVVRDWKSETRFEAPPLLIDHGVVSGTSVIVGDPQQPYGVLAAHTSRRRTFTREDSYFLEAVANILATAIERAHAEARIHASEQRYRQIVETATEGVWTIDGQARTDYINARGAEILGYTPGEMRGKSPLEFVFPEELAAASERLELLRQGAAWQLELRLRRKTGAEVWLNASMSAIVDNQATYLGALAMFVDITERKRADKRLREFAQRTVLLQEEDRRRVAHELHEQVAQGLVAAKIGLETLQADVPADLESVHARIGQVASQISERIRDIQALAQDLRPPSLDAAGLDRTLEGLCRSYERLSRLCVEYTGAELIGLPDAISISVYRLLQEALANVALHAEARHVRVSVVRDAGELRLCVEDDGRGFDLTTAPSDPARGLFKMREWLVLLGGSLQIQSQPGQGTRLVGAVPL